jgi:threonine dehydratase
LLKSKERLCALVEQSTRAFSQAGRRVILDEFPASASEPRRFSRVEGEKGRNKAPVAVIATATKTSEERRMEWPTPTLADVLKARAAIAPYLRPTPTIEPPALGAALGCRAFLKCENLQPTGAFKVRGGVNLVSTLTPEERSRGVIAASTGNHAQSVAFAARIFGTSAQIFMPSNANSIKVQATRSLGAEVILTGRDFDEARIAAERYAERAGGRYIHSANEPLLIAGVGTHTLELLEVVPDLEILFVPVGAGSGVLGAATVARAVNPRIRVIGVQSEGAPAVYRTWKDGRPFETERIETFAEGLATRQPFELPMQLLPKLVDEIMLVSDEEIKLAIRLLIATARQLAEGAGAAPVAAAAKRRSEVHGRKVGLILSGGNIRIEQLREILASDPTAGSASEI